MRKIAGSVDDLFGTVIRDALALADKEDRWADCLVWLSDVCILFAQHPDEIEGLMNHLLGKGNNGRPLAPVRSQRRARPRAGAEVVYLSSVLPSTAVMKARSDA